MEPFLMPCPAGAGCMEPALYLDLQHATQMCDKSTGLFCFSSGYGDRL